MVQRNVWDYKLYPNANGVIQPIAIPVTAGDRIEIYWENATKNLVYRIWALQDGASFAETTATNLVSYNQQPTDTATYTVATDGTLILGGLKKYPESLWGSYALRADFLAMKFL